MPTEIDSIEVNSLEDAFYGKFCECGHLLEEEHFYGFITKTSKCFAIINNGSVWISCDCSQIRPYKFEIRITL